MKNLHRKTGLLCCLFLASQLGFAQDINFSQFYDLPLLRNPAIAGLFQGDIRATSAFRSQWQSVTTPYKTFALGLELKRPVGRGDDFITYGMQATSDIAGDSRLSRTQVFPVFNFHKALNGDKNSYLSAGIMGGPVMTRFDPSKLNFDDQFVNGTYSASNPTKEVFSKTSYTYWDAAVGLCLSSKAGEYTRYYIGGGIFHFTKPKVAFQQKNDIVLNTKYVINGGLSYNVSTENQLILYLDYFMQGGARQGQGGLFYGHDLHQSELNEKVTIYAGLFYRWKDAFVPVVKLDFYKMSIGITYDVNTSKLKAASELRGGYEVTLSYKAFRNSTNSTLDKVRCPAFY